MEAPLLFPPTAARTAVNADKYNPHVNSGAPDCACVALVSLPCVRPVRPRNNEASLEVIVLCDRTHSDGSAR